jgi:ketosteroid isomerase-like protein
MMLQTIGSLVLILTVRVDAAIPAAAPKTIAETNAAWLEAMKCQDTAAIAAIYGDEAVLITLAGSLSRSRPRRRRRLQHDVSQNGSQNRHVQLKRSFCIGDALNCRA